MFLDKIKNNLQIIFQTNLLMGDCNLYRLL